MVDIVGRAYTVGEVEQVVDGCEDIVLGYMLGSKKVHLLLNRLLDEELARLARKTLGICLGDDSLKLLVANLLACLDSAIGEIVAKNELGTDGVVAEDLDDLARLKLNVNRVDKAVLDSLCKLSCDSGSVLCDDLTGELVNYGGRESKALYSCGKRDLLSGE